MSMANNDTCPYCGSNELEIVTVHRPIGFADYNIECAGCGAIYVVYYSLAGAQKRLAEIKAERARQTTGGTGGKGG